MVAAALAAASLAAAAAALWQRYVSGSSSAAGSAAAAWRRRRGRRHHHDGLMIFIFWGIFFLFARTQQVICDDDTLRSFWQGMDRSDKPNFLPLRFPTKSILTARQSRQKGREWWVGLEMDPKKIELIFCPSTPSHQNKLLSFYIDKPRGALPLRMCRNIVTLGAVWGWVGYWGAGGGWVDWKRGGRLNGLQIYRSVNPPQAANPNTAKDGLIALGTS